MDTAVEVDKKVDGALLLTELYAAGLTYITDLSFTDTRVRVGCREEDKTKVEGIIRAHDASAAVTAREAEDTKLRNARLVLRNFVTTPTASVTLAQMVNAFKSFLYLSREKYERDAPLEPPPPPTVESL